MNDIIQELEKLLGVEMLEKLTTINPSHIIKNEEFSIPDIIKIKMGFFD